MDESDGASLPKRGRPSVYGGKTTRIRLTREVFHEWTLKKEQMGYSNKTHSEFANILLQKVEESFEVATEIAVPGLQPKDTPQSQTGTYITS